MIDWRQHTHSVLSLLDIRANKTKGQNFIVKPSVIRRIVEAANITSDDKIIEIGGGIGILTHALVESGAEITVFEKETKLAKHLKETYQSANIIEADALKEVWPYHNKVIANLPYSISSQILDKILHNNATTAVVMVQKEVAERCIAQPGDRNYSRISVLCQLHATVKKLFNVGPNAFFPRPKITSTVIHLAIQPPEIVNQHDEIELLVRSLFTLRRRVLRSVLRSFLRKKDILPIIWKEAPYIEKRVFQLNINELDDLVSYLKSQNSWEKGFLD
ncbi:MAG: ribosomal RNA small subunit methyltransferase A [Candidatus Heimdallarchaeota archaeon]|nr:ribosomal RNA small subunit methyltransferase A [Candidatus Heimdallarchaeota archaeon]